MAFKVVVKNGSSKYVLNKSGQYVYKDVDFVQEYEDAAEALREFLENVVDNYNNEKVTLVFDPKKKKGKK